MGMLLVFMPFIVFAGLNQIIVSWEALICGAAVSAVLIARDLLKRQSLKILETCTFLLFGGLAVYLWRSGADWSVIRARLCVDTGLLLIVLASLAVRQPFTLQYAQSRVPPAVWNQPEFIRTNYVITGAWALAFAVMIFAELALLYLPGLPHSAGIIVIILALVGAMKFSGWYPERVKQQVQ